MCWHNWPKWQVVEEFIGEYVRGGGIARVLIQKRTCQKCGKTELDRQVA